MKMIARALAVTLVVGALVQPEAARAAMDAASIAVYKAQQDFLQTNAVNSPALHTNAGWRFGAVVAMSGPGSVQAATVQRPGGGTDTLRVQGTSLLFMTNFDSQAQLDTAYANGTYHVELDTRYDGRRTVTLHLTNDAWPATPRVANFAAAQAVNPAADFTLVWEPMTGGTAQDFIQVEIENSRGERVWASPGFGQPGALNGTHTSVVIPGLFLPPSDSCRGRLFFAKVVSTDISGYPGVPNAAGYAKRTEFPLTTTVPPLGLSLTPPSLPADATNELRLAVTGLATGQSVRVEIFQDFDTDGAVDAGEPLLHRFELTDGQAAAIDGVRNLSVPGDEDGAADGLIRSILNLRSEDEVRLRPGVFVVRVSPVGGGFEPLTSSLTVTQPTSAQSVVGQVRSGGAPVPFALVFLIGPSGEAPVATALADANGQFSLPCPTGTWLVGAVRPGYLFDFGSATPLTVAAGATITNHVNVLASDRTISGRLTAEDTGQPLAGVEGFAESERGLVGLFFTDTNGTFEASVSSAELEWRLKFSAASAGRLGYVVPRMQFESGVLVNLSTGSVSGLELTWPRATALVYGRVTDSQGRALPHYPVTASGYGSEVSGHARADGRYALGVAQMHGMIRAGTTWLDGFWYYGQETWMWGEPGQAGEFNLVAQAANTPVAGQVVDDGGTPVADVYLNFYSWGGASVEARTGPDGRFDLNLFGGRWNLRLDEDDARARRLIGPTLEFTVVAGQPLTNLLYTVLRANLRISGTLRDPQGQGLSNIQVFAWGQAGDTNLGSVFGFTDAQGAFELAVVAGSWNVNVDCSSLSARCLCCPESLSVIVTDTNVFVPLVAPAFAVATNLSVATVNQPYWFYLGNCWAGSFSWSVVSNAPPPGLTLGVDGYLSGTPTEVGLFTFTVRAGNAICVVEGPVTLRVLPPAAPDLVPISLSAPATANLQTTIPISYLVTNVGPVDASPWWWDRIYLSADAQWDADDREVYAGQLWYYIPTGSAYSLERNLTLPCVPPGDWFLVLVVNATGQLTETDRSNNLLATPITLRADASPDLWPVSLDAPISVEPGGFLSVSWVGTNTGGGATPSYWTDRLYLSTDPLLGTNDVEVCNWWGGCGVTRWGALNPGQGYNQFASLAAPTVAPGDYFLLVQLDADGSVCEQTKTNNLLARPLRVAAPADLQLLAAVAPTSAVPAGTIEVIVTVTNHGPATALPGWADAVYLSADATWQPGQDILLATFTPMAALPAGAAYSWTQAVQVACVPPGDWQLLFITDFNNMLAEGNEANNLLARPLTLDQFVDLAPLRLVAPAQAGPRELISVSWALTNHGPLTATPPWTDRLYLSPTPTWSQAAIELTTVQCEFCTGFTWPDPLPGTTAATGATVQARIPSVAAGAWYLLLRLNADQTVCESTRTNNDLAVPITVLSPADLMAVSWDAPPAADSGQSLPLTWAVTNISAQTAWAPWTDLVYLSTNAVLDPTDRLLGSFTWLTALAPGQGYLGLQTVALPALSAGQYHLILWVDGSEQLVETDEANNRLVQPIQILNADLTPTSVQIASTVAALGNVPVTWTVLNAGAGGAQPWWSDRFLLATNGAPPEQAQVLGTFWVRDPLPSSQAYTQSQTLYLPALPSGAYQLTLQADAGNAVRETDETNNTLTVPLTVANPDLAVTLLGGLNPRWAVSATASSSAGPGFDANAALGPPDVLYCVGTMGGWMPSGTGTNLEWLQVDFGTPASALGLVVRETYQPGFIQRVDLIDTNGTAHTVWTGSDSTLCMDWFTLWFEPTPYLVQGARIWTSINGREQIDAVGLLAEPPGPIAAVSQQEVLLLWQVNNLGPGPVPGGWWDRLYFSTDATWSTNDAMVLARYQSGPLPVGGASLKVASLRLPQSDQGNYWLLARTDDASAYYEDNEANNLAAVAVTLAAPADLAVTSLTAPSTGCTRSGATVIWTVSNVGSNATQLSWTDRVYLSADPAWDAADLLLGSVAVRQPLAPSASYTNSVTFIWPGVPAGLWYMLVKADADGALYEASETNNLQAVPVPVNNPDLVPIALQVPGTLQSTQRFQPLSLTWTVANLGACAAEPGWNDLVYLSTDPVWDAQDRWLAGATRDTVLLANDSYQVTYNAWLPEGTVGQFYVLLRLDDYNQLYESSDENNFTNRPIEIVLAPVPDLVVTNIAAPPEAVSGQDILVSWVVTNQSSAEVRGRWRDAVYWASRPDDPNPVYVRDFVFEGVLSGGGAVLRAQRVTVPVNFSGPYWVVVRTDFWNEIYERDGETNNVSVALEPVQVRLKPYPNLQVSFVNAPPTAYSGQQAVIQWGVTNAGTGGTTVPTWYDRVWLSADTVFDRTTDTLLSPEAANPSYLDAGDAYVNSLAVRLPRGLDGPHYFFVQTDAYNQVNEHTNEHDNVLLGGPTQIILTPPPDLQVLNVSAPVQALSGQGLPVTFTVTNAGAGRTEESGWWDGIYVSRTNDLDASAVWLGRVWHSGALEPGDSYTVSNFVVTLPVAYTGACWIVVMADVYSAVYEHVFEQNNLGATPRTTEVRLTPPPDLEVTLVDAPATALAGRPLTVRYRVANYGSTPTPNSFWEDRLFLSEDTQLDAADRRLATLPRWGALDIGQEYERSFTVTLPDTLTGVFYAIVHADSGNVVFELDNTNNIAFDPEPVRILFAPPDLVATNLVAPPGANAGSAFLVSWTVLNLGAGDSAQTRWVDRVVLSADTTLGNSDDRTLLELTREGLLGAGAAYTVSNQLVSMPVTVAAGHYYLFVLTDSANQVFEGTNEHNNASPPRPISVTRQTADLAVGEVTAPASAQTEDTIAVSWVVQNLGAAAPNVTSWDDAVYLSADPVWSAGDRWLGSFQSLLPLPPGAAYTNRQSVRLPADAAGDWYVLVMADPGGRVIEPGARDNNASAAPNRLSVSLRPVADLVVTNVDAPTEAWAGQSLTVSWTVRNQGNAPAGENFYDAVYLSPDQFFDREIDLYLGYAYRPYALTNSAAYTQTRSFSLPPGLSGLYYVIVVTDVGNHVRERDGEGNNTGFDPVAVQVRLLPPADLVVGTLTIPANAVPGRPVEVTYTVHNQGANAARGAWLDALYISADTRWDLGDPLLGRKWFSGEVPPGSNYTATILGPMPGVMPGEYHVLLRSDILNHLAESNETNNLGASLDRMVVDAEALRLGEVRTNSLAAGQAAWYRFTATDGQTVRIQLDALNNSSANELYVRFGQMASRSQFDAAAQEPFVSDPELVLPISQSGTYYLMVYAAGAPTAFSLRADLLPFSVTAVRPTLAGNRGEVTVRIAGALFTSNTVFQAVSPAGPALSAVTTRVLDSASAVATFNFAGAPIGWWTLRAWLPGEPPLATELTNAIFVQPGIGPRVEVAFDGDLAIRPNRVSTFRLLYANTGDADTAAPLLLAWSAAGRPVGLSSADLRTNSLHLLGLNGSWPYTTLVPGTLHGLMLHVEAAAGGSRVDMRARAILADDPQLITEQEWLDIETAVRPGTLSEAQWTLFWANLRPRIGSTWGDYVQFLNRLAADLTERGVIQRDVRAMLAAIYTEDPNYRAASTLAGQALDTNGVPQVNLELAAYRVSGGRHVLGGTATTDASGRFSLRFLPPGDYVFALLEGGFDQNRDGLVDASPPQVTLTRETDLTNVMLYVVPPQPFTAPPDNEDSPALTLDSTGTPHLLWSRGGFVWHARFDGTNWVDARAVSEAPGNSLALAAAPNLINGTDAGLIAVWEQGADNETEIFYAVARPLAGGGRWQWSRPVRLTSDAIRDAAPAVGVNGLGQALVVWLKRNAAIQDDTDLYFALVNVASGALEWTGSAGQLARLAGGGSLHFGYIKTWGPYYAYGMRFETGVDIGIDGGISGCAAAVSGNAKGMMSFLLPGFRGFDFEGTGAISANWEAHKRRCEWQFKGAQLDAVVQGAFNWKDGLATCLNGLGPPGVAAAKGIHLAIAALHRWTPLRVNQGIQVTVGVEMADLRWRRLPPLPGWVPPDHIGSMDLIAGLGPYAKLSQESVSDVEFALSGAIRGRIGILPSFTPKELFGNIQLAARIRSFSFNRNWNITLAGGEGEMASAADGELPGGLVMTYDPSAALGTGNVYGTNALRADVASDIYRDSPPALLRHADGRLAAVWSREEDPTGTNDCLLYVAEFNGATWTAPAIIPGSGGLHSALGAVVDGSDQRLVVWAAADASSLGPTTTFEQLQAVRDAADLFWTVYADEAWSPPTRLAHTAGPDADVALTRLSNNEVLLTWTVRDRHGVVHLLSARWNGTAWSAVIALASGDLATPQPTELGGAPAVFWAEDTNPDPEIEVAGLRFRRFLGGAWQPAQNFAPVLAEPPAPAPVLRERARLASSLLPPVPDSCCECKQMRHVSSGSGDCVRGTDFDEATCTHITFYEPCVPPPVDPNDILGPPGFGEARWVPASATLAYTIRFENITNAAAPAQEVLITHPLDPDLDWRTFRLGNFGLGTLVITVPTNRAFYSTRLDLTESRGFYVDVVAGIDVATGEAYWRFTTIDPATGETPTDPRRGFLPPNTNAPAGEGFVTYTIRAKPGVITGSRVDAQATIVFDTEAPIDTPPIFNTLDAGRPTSMVLPLPPVSTDPIFPVAWTGADEVGGSALASFDIYVSENGGPYRLWLGQTTLTDAPFTGAPGHIYAFYSLARDNAGNVEEAPLMPDAVIIVAGANTPPVLTVPGTLTVLEGETLVATNSATDPDLPPQTLTFSLDPNAPAGATMNPTNGVFTWTPGEADGPGTNLITVIVTDDGTPSLSATQSFTVIVLESNTPPSLAPLADVTMFEETTLAIQIFATDPDLPPQRLTFSLGIRTPPSAAIDPATGWLTWTPLEDDGPGTFTVTVWVTDDGPPPLAASRQFTVTVLETNSPPRLAPVPPQTAYVLVPLVVTNVATDTDPRGDTITFGLGPEAPAGSRILPRTGRFIWRPSREQAPSTNLITVWAMDDGFEPLAATNTFTVIVTDYLELELGQALVPSGQTASVPVRVTSTAPVQALDFVFFAPSEHLSPPTLTDLAPAISTNLLELLGGDWWRVHLGFAPGSSLLGTQTVARLDLLTASTHSAFVPLLVSNVAALQTNGAAMPHTLATPGRVVMVAAQPLLEALLSTNGQRTLRLYGPPATGFVLEQTSDLAGPWQPVTTNLTITNLLRVLPSLPPTNAPIFYRLRQE